MGHGSRRHAGGRRARGGRRGVDGVARPLRPERVSARTREHVQAVARRLDYRPNLLARGLPSGRTRLLALLVTDITNPHPSGLICRAETQAGGGGIHPGARRQPGAPGAGGRAQSPGWAHRWTGSCWRPAAAPTTSWSSCSAVGRSRCTTGSSPGSRAWSTTRTTAADRSSTTWLRWAIARWPTSAAPATRGRRNKRWEALAAHSRGAGVEIVRLGPFPPRPWRGVSRRPTSPWPPAPPRWWRSTT